MSENTVTPAPLSGYTFRPATADDLPALAALEAGCFGDPWSEAIVDMPIKTPRLPQATREMMDAGLRRRLSKNVKYLSQKRDPNTGEMSSYEDWENMGGDDMIMNKDAESTRRRKRGI